MRAIEPGGPSSRAAHLPGDFVAFAPGRVNLIGEHVDYNAGLCLPLALPHHTLAGVTGRKDDTVTVTSAQVEEPWEGRIGSIGPGEVTGWAAYVVGVLWALGELGHDIPGMDIHVDSTVPTGAGLSSSAALECSVAVAVTALLGIELGAGPKSDTARQQLVEACVRAETEVAGAPTGGLDQKIAMFARAGNCLLIDFADGATRQVPFDPAAHGLELLVIDTRVRHALTDGGYGARREDCERAAQELGLPSLRPATLDEVAALPDPQLRKRARHVVTEIERAATAAAALQRDDWQVLGPLLVGSHASLRDDYEVSCDELDVAVETSLAHGAVGARMTGGGFGGSAIALVPEGASATVAAAVDAAFDRHGYRPPAYLGAVPSGGAAVLRRPGMPSEPAT